MNEKLKIGFFIDTFYPMVDGVISVVDNYAKLLSEFADVTVFCPNAREKNYTIDKPYKIVRCSRIKLAALDYDLPMPFLDSKFIKKVDKSELDIVHIHSPFSIGKMGATYAKKHKIPAIITLHSQFKQDFYSATNSTALTKMLLKNIMKVFNACDKVFTMNPACENLAREYGVKIPIELVPNGTDFKLPNLQDGYKTEIREKFGVKPDEKLFLYVGRINILKNIEFIINSLENLTKKGFKYKMVFVGSGNDKEYFENLVQEKNLTDNVIFAGKIMNRDELCKIYASGDLFVFPSFYDTDGIVKTEAAACNVPTIFVEGSIAASCCTDKVNGYIGKNDYQLFAEKIVDIFDEQDIYNMVRKNCYKDLYITWQQVIEIVKQKYIQTIAEKKEELKTKELNSKQNLRNKKKNVLDRAKNIAKINKQQNKKI